MLPLTATRLKSKTTSSLANGIVASASSTSIYSTTTGEKDLTINDNHVDGGYFAIRLYGSSAGRNENVEISGNTVMNTYYYGIYVYYGTDVTISDNHLSDFGSCHAYGIYQYQIDGLMTTSTLSKMLITDFGHIIQVPLHLHQFLRDLE